MTRYLRGFRNYQPQDRKQADQIALSEMITRFDHPDGSVTINFLQETPVQAGQTEWKAI